MKQSHSNRNISHQFKRRFKWLFILTLAAVMLFSIPYYFRYDIIRYLKSKSFQWEILNRNDKLLLHDYRNREILHHYSQNIIGVDISHYQTNVSFDDLDWVYDEFPLRFIILRSSMGWNGKDKDFSKRWSELSNSRFVRGAYHFYRPDEPSLEQARNFIETVTLETGDLPPILDIETLPKLQSMARLKVGLKNWLNIVEEHYGVKPIIYSGQHFYENYLKSDFKDYPIWIANYNHRSKKIPAYSMMWQFTEKGIVNGISGKVDVNVFNGDWEEFEKWRIKAVRQ